MSFLKIGYSDSVNEMRIAGNLIGVQTGYLHNTVTFFIMYLCEFLDTSLTEIVGRIEMTAFLDAAPCSLVEVDGL